MRYTTQSRMMGAKRLARRLLPDPLYRIVRRRRVARLVEDYETSTVVHDYGGNRLQVRLADPLAEGWYDHDWPQLPEIELLRRGRLRPGARVFDLGAHQCVLAVIVARIVGEAGTVVAVEAEPHNVRVAEENRDLNRVGNLAILHAAVSDIPGSIAFAEGLNGRVREGKSWGTVSVPALTVDSLAKTHGPPDVVMIDVEGFEHRVLAGARHTLLSAGTDFFVEVHARAGLEEAGGSVREVLSMFAPNSYDCFIAPASSELESYGFVPLAAGRDLTERRFFLVALDTRRTEPCRQD